MTFVQDLEAKFAGLKDKAEGDLHGLVLKLEALFNRVHQAQLADGLKQALSADIHAAATHVEAVADNVRSDVDVVDKAVDVADDAVDKAASKK
jgi:hypothetical protein